MVLSRGSSKAGFGTYDLFAYIIPGTLLLGTVAVPLTHAGFAPFLEASLPFDGTFLRGLVLSAVFAMFAYIAGLVVHQAGKTLEALRRDGPPSKLILSEDRLLKIQIADAVRSRLAEKLDIEEHEDQQLWEIAYRRISLDGADQRVKQFQFLHTVTRGTAVVACLWILLSVAYLFWTPLFSELTGDAAHAFGAAWLLLGAILAPTMYKVRGRFDYAVAREVILAYYMARVEPDL